MVAAGVAPAPELVSLAGLFGVAGGFVAVETGGVGVGVALLAASFEDEVSPAGVEAPPEDDEPPLVFCVCATKTISKGMRT